jgi:hypothetical protein
VNALISVQQFYLRGLVRNAHNENQTLSLHTILIPYLSLIFSNTFLFHSFSVCLSQINSFLYHSTSVSLSSSNSFLCQSFSVYLCISVCLSFSNYFLFPSLSFKFVSSSFILHLSFFLKFCSLFKKCFVCKYSLN